MKKFDLVALSRINFEDVSRSLHWLRFAAGGSAAVRLFKMVHPVMPDKVGPLLKCLDDFGFIKKTLHSVSMTCAGLDFLTANSQSKKAMLRARLMSDESISRVMQRLGRSPSGRIPKRTIFEVFNSTSQYPVMEFEILGFIAWAGYTDLFQYDPARAEVQQSAPRLSNSSFRTRSKVGSA